MYCYFRLTGSHPTLPLAELRALLEVVGDGGVVGVYGPIALATCRDPVRTVRDVIKRAGLIKWGGVLLTGGSDPEEALRGLKERIGEIAGHCREEEPCRVELHRLQGLWADVEPGSSLKRIVELLDRSGVPLSGSGPRVVEAIYVEGIVIIGIRLYTVDLKPFHERSPARRPFFKPGPLDVRLSRALVNMARLREGQVFWDPFCGTGGLALEACFIGASKCLCGDISPEMASGSRVNLDYYGVGSRALSYLGDALAPPLTGDSVEAVATDPPYGRSTTLAGRDRRGLYRGFLERAQEALARGSYLVFAGPAEERLHELALEAGFRVAERHYMYVHGSLVREVVVAIKH